MTVITINCIVVSIIIICLYAKGKLTAGKASLLAFASQSFNIELAGPTITTLFCVTFYFLIEDIIKILTRKQTIIIYKKSALLAVVPLVMFIVTSNYFFFDSGILERKYEQFSLSPFLLFYFKNYLFFLFVIARKVSLQSTDSIEGLLVFCEKIAFYSCVLAFVQIVVNFIVPEGSQISLFFGNKPEFAYNLLNMPYVRPSAFFNEPKEFAGFLGFLLPYVVLKKKNAKVVLFCLVGILTVSTTFFVISLLAFVFFVVLGFVEGLRPKILGSIMVILISAILISHSADYLVETFGDSQENYFYELVTKRQLSRVMDKNLNYDERSDFYGIPLQKDLELPVVNFMRDYPVVFLLGHGPGNAKYVPNEYFKGTWAYNAKVEGRFIGHMNMGWLNYVAELGFISFSILFILVTQYKGIVFNKNYYSFAVAVLFFYRIDIVLAIFYGVANFHKSEKCVVEFKGG